MDFISCSSSQNQLTGIGLIAQTSGFFSSVTELLDLAQTNIFLTLIIEETNQRATISYPFALNDRIHRQPQNQHQITLIESLFRKYCMGILSSRSMQNRIRGMFEFNQTIESEISGTHLLKDPTSRKKILLEDILEVIPHSRSTWFHQACASGDQELVKEMVEYLSKLDLNHIDIKNDEGLTPLMCAVRNNHYEITDFLLLQGANPNATDNKGNTPLHLAAETGREDLIDLVIGAGGKAIPNTLGMTPLYYLIDGDAVAEMNPIMRNLIYKAGDDINAVFYTCDQTPYNLINIAAGKRSDALSMLLECGVNPNLLHLGETSFDNLSREQPQDVRLRLLERVDPTVRGESGNNSLHVACQELQLTQDAADYIENLVRKHKDHLNVKNLSGISPFELLVQNAMRRNSHLLSCLSLFALLTGAGFMTQITGKNFLPTPKDFIDDEVDTRFFQLTELFKEMGAEANLYSVISLYRLKQKYPANDTVNGLYNDLYLSFCYGVIKWFLFFLVTQTYAVAVGVKKRIITQ